MTTNTTAIISSTVYDLPEHREQVKDACLRQNMFPKMMEHLGATNAEAIAESLKMVDEASVYLGVFAHHYGTVPSGYRISISEMEYNRAVEQNIPRLIFLMHDDHPVKASDVDKGEDAVKLEEFKKRLRGERVVGFFRSPEELRTQVVDSLSKLRQPDLTTFHYVGDIPEPPKVYIAHPYTLMQTRKLVGRQKELNLLTDWITESQQEMQEVRILSVIAIGGLGKSALTWKWFNEIATQEKRFAGRMWWSFYESDATFENFIVRALAYVTHQPRRDVEQITPLEREARLLAALEHEPFLIVLDGLERLLTAYARMDAAYILDDELDQQTANMVANAYGLPSSAARSFTGEHRLRKTTDPRVGTFLRKLANVRATRVLVSTRLYPVELQSVTREALPGCAAIFLEGLRDEDALEMWRALGVRGARDTLVPIFNHFDNHPLLLQALASEVAHFRPAPGDWERWRVAHPDFDPFKLPLVQVKSHVLDFALSGLDERARKVLHTVAAFRMPARYDTLAALLVGPDKPCVDEGTLDAVLTDLEDRGLLGWDRRANRYDLHPVVRGVVWTGLGDSDQRDVYSDLESYFADIPSTTEDEVSSLEDLTPAIELYNTLVGLERYEDAYDIFGGRLFYGLVFLGESGYLIELLEEIWIASLQDKDLVPDVNDRFSMASCLGVASQLCGKLEDCITFYRSALEDQLELDESDAYFIHASLTIPLCALGRLTEAEHEARSALIDTKDQTSTSDQTSASAGAQSQRKWMVALAHFALTAAVRGNVPESQAALKYVLESIEFTREPDNEHSWLFAMAGSNLSQLSLWMKDYDIASSSADRAAHWAQTSLFHRSDTIRAIRLQGTVALARADFIRADELLNRALSQARKVNFLEQELSALITLAELRRRNGYLTEAREFLEDAWDLAERGPFVLLQTDAYNVLAQIERDAGDNRAAVEAATNAYYLAWCDGPPFAYHWGLSMARRHLHELSEPEPLMPSFDPEKHGPMPEVQID